jgi:hypothetical protein
VDNVNIIASIYVFFAGRMKQVQQLRLFLWSGSSGINISQNMAVHFSEISLKCLSNFITAATLKLKP